MTIEDRTERVERTALDLGFAQAPDVVQTCEVVGHVAGLLKSRLGIESSGS